MSDGNIITDEEHEDDATGSYVPILAVEILNAES
jgi:hypothetical protein